MAGLSNSTRHVEVYCCVKGGQVQGGASNFTHILVKAKPNVTSESQHWTIEVRMGSDFDACLDCRRAYEELLIPVELKTESANSSGGTTGMIDVRRWDCELKSQVMTMLSAGAQNEKILQAISLSMRNGKLPTGPLPKQQQLNDLRRKMSKQPVQNMIKTDPYFGLMDEQALEDFLRKRSLGSGYFDESLKFARTVAAAHRAHDDQDQDQDSESSEFDDTALAVKNAEMTLIQWLSAQSKTGLQVVPGVTNGNEIIVLGIVYSEEVDASERHIVGWFFSNMLMLMTLFLAIRKHGPKNLQINIDGTYNVIDAEHVSSEPCPHS